MHFRSLLAVELPEVTPDPAWEAEVQKDIERASADVKEENGDKIMQNVLRKMTIRTMVNVSTAFGRELSPVISEAMERFFCETEDPRYREFEDMTEELTTEYAASVDCIKLPNGSIVEVDSHSVWDKFIIRDGKVFQKYAGPLHHEKRTKKAKKMQALLNYPRKKVYKSLADYVEQESYAVLNEETKRYGYWYNPDAVYDWYQIGGRWPAMFLVKEDCKEYSFGERSWCNENEEYPAPEGYIWVSAARKKDIQWDMMRQWRNEKATERFKELEAMFISGEIDETVHKIDEEGIFAWGEVVYKKGQTLEEYLDKYGIPESSRYPLSVYSIFHKDECISESAYEHFDQETKKFYTEDGWNDTVFDFVDDADDYTVFVAIDYHM